ncbi:ATP-binding protein [Pelagibius sp. 7325]|uniref:ATP-binding protein n=1 Tax=Pelagibius sp. 7325 TaxID=3131994 RepID=UPI0030EB2A42
MDRPGKGHSRGLFLDAEHQLRQPLNALSLLIGELRQGPDQHELTLIADDMRYAVALSNAWLESLANVERARQGLLSLQVEDVPLRTLFDRLREDFTPHFTGLGLTLKVAPTRAVVRADPVVLRNLLAILLDNAAKFTREGKVLLGCRRDCSRWRIEVWDSGLGIAENQLKHLFEPFFRLENEVRPRERGLGLGLTYARQLAELAGDPLTVASTLGKGSCFALSVPRADEAAAGAVETAGKPAEPLDAAVGNPLAGADVVVLEGVDAPALQACLEGWGAKVHVVPPAGLAVALERDGALVIADRAAFDAGARWDVPADGGPPVILLADAPLVPGDPLAAVAQVLLRPVRPARLRALCHYVLSRR